MTRLELETAIKEAILSAVELEDMTAADIDTDAPLFGEGLGLDSIDALEIGMALRKKFSVKFSAEQEENKPLFKSVKTLADFIEPFVNK